MNATDYIAAVLAVVAVWGLTTAIPNYRNAKTVQRRLKRDKINGFNSRIARSKTRVQRNIAMGLAYILSLALTVAIPTIHIGNSTLSGLWLTLGLMYATVALAFWSRAERDDGESAHLELMRIAQERIDEMSAQRNDERDAERDPIRDAGRDEVRDVIRDEAHDKELEGKGNGK